MRKAILILLLAIAPNLFSQNQDGQEVRIVNHQVLMGETVKMLSKKYLVPPSEIYRLNKFAVDGISQGMVLRIPVPVKDEPIKEESVKQEPVAEQKSVREAVAETPAPVRSQEPVSETPKETDVAVSASDAPISHRVGPGETLSGLARQYNVSAQAIKDANPKVAKRGLQADENIKIPVSGGVVPSNESATFSTSAPANSDASSSVATGETIKHKVEPGETLIGLSQKYNVSVDVIKRQNSRILARGLQAGQVIKITPE
ncbi:LysM peptidoglycan-binding domain-containing protein [Flavobacterium sp. MAH-1]|uniref:LysM peptidoglycan-binding domain-containing protein n=1 Tax=Flavobacterium agri TaxID=2743471 RepID=A0A7Y8Y776_9FLAO|nr:LysM peptidoglycan-binding domain-containing protein [Flavobacterium agri]NUY82431.1 LysM peptidoglycan-binding domain-containing protein [Flavobacterium agri]NYA72455.1 LysM peptidoglycan-binding domain-containing protein [Flavobacterium agri]